MCLRLLFLFIGRLVAWLRLSRRDESWKTAEILLLRHELTVLQRQFDARPKLTWADRALIAVLLDVVPRSRRAGLPLIVTPDTVLRWHRGIVRWRWAQKSRHRQCGRPRTHRGRRQRRYQCPHQLGGCGRSIDAALVERLVEERMIALLADPDSQARLAEHELGLTEARTAQLVVIDGIRDQLVELEVKAASGEIIREAYDKAKPILDRRLKKKSAALQALEMPSIGTPINAAAEWDDLTDDERRQAIRRHHLHIEIGATRPGFRNQPDPERVTITP